VKVAIDTTLFAADIPAGTYNVGDIIPLVNIDGPANVRSGRGAAKLKSVICGQFNAATPYFRIHIKNSDWIDELASFTGAASGNFATTLFDDESGAVQKGHDCNLTPNSGWQVYAECVVAGTPTAANSIFALIDIDYPEVGGVTDPKKAVGFPTTINYDIASVPSAAFGSLVGSTWTSQSVDYFKAGFKYVLDAVELSSSAVVVAFVAFANAAGMGGLTRIIPIINNPNAIRYSVKYSSVLVKGPMDIKIKAFQATAGTFASFMAHDYVKQKA